MIWAVLIAVAIGFSVAFQPVTNAAGSQQVGIGPLLVFGNVIVLAVSMAYALWGPGRSDWGGLTSLRPDLLLGSPIYGCIILFGGIYAFPKLGASLTIALIVLSQCVFAMLIDSQGLYGIPKLSLTWPRALGVLLVLAGVLVIQFGKK